MVEVMNLDEILQKNPSISPREMKRIDEITKELRKMGVKPRGYRIATPHERRQARRGCDEDAPDPRTVRLSGP